jgi:hypothetical protein
VPLHDARALLAVGIELRVEVAALEEDPAQAARTTLDDGAQQVVELERERAADAEVERAHRDAARRELGVEHARVEGAEHAARADVDEVVLVGVLLEPRDLRGEPVLGRPGHRRAHAARREREPDAGESDVEQRSHELHRRERSGRCGRT